LEIGIAGAAAGLVVYAVFGDLPFALGECCVCGGTALPILAGAGSLHALLMFGFIRHMAAEVQRPIGSNRMNAGWRRFARVVSWAVMICQRSPETA
jgi:hypothetical protein